MAFIKRFLSEQGGVTAMEYGLLAGLISLMIVSAIFLMGDSVYNMFSVFNSFMAGNMLNN